MKTYLRVLSYARPLGLLAPQYILYVILQSVFSVFTLAILQPVLTVLFQTKEKAVAPVDMPAFEWKLSYVKEVFDYYFLNMMQDDPMRALTFVCIVLIISIFLSNLFKYLVEVIAAIVKAQVISNLRNTLFGRLMTLHIGYYTEERKGNIMSKVTSDVQEVEASVVSSLKAVIKEPIMIIGYFAMLFFISVKLTLITILIIPVSGFIISFIAKKLKRKAHQSQETLGRISDILEETLGGMRIVKAFNAIDFSKSRFGTQVNNYARLNISMTKRFALASPISEFIGVGVVALILLIGGSEIFDGNSSLEPESFITFIAIFSQVLVPAKSLSGALSNVQKGLASAERIFSIIDTKPAIVNIPNALEFKSFNDKIEVKNLRFGYQQTPVLKDINMTIKKVKWLL